MDLDIKELEDLCQENVANQQDPAPKPVDSPTDAPGLTEASESTPTLATATSEIAESQSSKQPKNNREDLTGTQNASKVNQDLFYQAQEAPHENGTAPEAQQPKKKKKNKKKNKAASDLQSDLDGSILVENGALVDVDDTLSNTNQTN